MHQHKMYFFTDCDCSTTNRRLIPMHKETLKGED